MTMTRWRKCRGEISVSEGRSLTRSPLGRAALMFVAVVLCGAGASIAAATRSDRALWLNPASPGALVEYSINSDGTGRTQISDFGPQVDQHLSGDAYPFFTLSRSQDGSEFSMGRVG